MIQSYPVIRKYAADAITDPAYSLEPVEMRAQMLWAAIEKYFDHFRKSPTELMLK